MHDDGENNHIHVTSIVYVNAMKKEGVSSFWDGDNVEWE